MDSREYRADDLQTAISAAVGATGCRRMETCLTESKAGRLVPPTDGLFGGRWEFRGSGEIRIEVQSIATLGFLGFRGWAEAFAVDENGRLVPNMSQAGTSQQLGGHVGPMRTYTQTIRANFRARAVLWRVHLRATRQAALDNASPFFFRVFG